MQYQYRGVLLYNLEQLTGETIAEIIQQLPSFIFSEKF